MSEAVAIHILDREYTIGCAAGERDSLLDAAGLLDRKMRELRSEHRLASIDRLAILAALEFAHELQQSERRQLARETGVRDTIARINVRLDEVLAGLGTHAV